MGYHEISFLSYFGDRNVHFFYGKSDWPAGNSRKAQLADMPVKVGNLPPMDLIFLLIKEYFVSESINLVIIENASMRRFIRNHHIVPCVMWLVIMFFQVLLSLVENITDFTLSIFSQAIRQSTIPSL